MLAVVGTLLALGIISIAVGTFYTHYYKNNDFSWKPTIFLSVGMILFFIGIVFDFITKV